MALRMLEGFDWAAATTDLTMKWTASDLSGSSLQTGRTGSGQCLQFTPLSTTDGLRKTVDAQQIWYIGVAYRTAAALPGTNNEIIRLMDGATLHVALQVLNSGQLRILRSTTTLATSVNAISANVWYYIELYCKIGDAGTGAYEVRVNGTSTGWLIDADEDTRNGANATANIIGFGGSGSVGTSSRWDDIYIADGTGGQTFYGDVQVQTKLADGAGDNTDFTPSAGAKYTCVDDATLDSDTTYVASSTPGHIDTYTFADVSAGYTVHGVAGNIIARKTDAGGRTARVIARSAADTDYTGDTESPSTSYVNYQKIWALNPATAAAWALADLNAYEFGVEVVA